MTEDSKALEKKYNEDVERGMDADLSDYR